ncbi:MAG: AI-2E family transporter [Aerococcaceae bacterium]|nr:AI-2E family transporter [Aerococcaceae bacterium]
MEKLDKLLMKYLILIASLVLIVVNGTWIIQFLQKVQDILMPIIFGGIIAYILNLLMVRYEAWLAKHFEKNAKLQGAKRGISIALALITIIVGAVIIVGIIFPQFLSALSKMVEGIPNSIKNVQSIIQANQQYFPQISELLSQLNINWGQITQNIVTFLNDVVSGIVAGMLQFVSNFASHMINFVLSLMLSMYILVSKEKLANQFNRLLNVILPNQVHRYLLHVLEVMDASFSNFITGAVTEATILGTLVTVGMLLTGLPYAGMIGVLTGVLALIPVLGAYISATIGTLMILAVSPAQAGFFLIFILIIQQFEGNVVYPRVVGNSIGLPGIWVIISVTIVGGLFGISGMLIGVPLVATIYKLVKEAVEAKEAQE